MAVSNSVPFQVNYQNHREWQCHYRANQLALSSDL